MGDLDRMTHGAPARIQHQATVMLKPLSTHMGHQALVSKGSLLRRPVDFWQRALDIGPCLPGGSERRAVSFIGLEEASRASSVQNVRKNGPGLKILYHLQGALWVRGCSDLK